MTPEARTIPLEPEDLDPLGVGLVLQAPDGALLHANATARRLVPEIGDGRVPEALPMALVILRRTTAGGETVTLIGPVPADDPRNHLVRTIVDATPVGVCITDENGVFEHVNAAYTRFYGYSADELVGRHFTLVVPEHLRATLRALHDTFLHEGAEIRGEWEVERRDGSRATILADACRIVGSDGRPRKVTFVIDITERTRMAAELARANARLQDLAMNDELTGLPNRRRSLQVLQDAGALAARYGGDLSVAVLDLDHFKRVNDTWGHEVGDTVLRDAGAAVRGRLRGTDTLGRIGGEEFVLVLPGTAPPAAVSLVTELRAVVRERVRLPDGTSVTFSGGLTDWRADDGPDTVLRRADEALYRAKDAGRDRIELA